MGHLALPSALAIGVLTLLSSRQAGPPPAPPPQLAKADEEWAGKKYAAAVEFGRAGKWGHDEAQEPVREILDLCARKLGDGHYVTAFYRREIETLKKLAALPEADRAEYLKTYLLWEERDALSGKRRYADALKPAAQLLPIYRRCLGPGSYYEALAAVQYGILLRTCERFAEAEEQFRSARTIYLKVLGEYNPRTVEATVHLALTLEELSRYEEALRLYEAALDVSRRLLGDGHAQTAVIRNNLAGQLNREARYADAEPLYRAALDAHRAAGGEDGPFVPMARNNLAVNLDAQGKYAEAEKLYRRAMDTQRTAGREDHPDTALFYGNLGVNLDSQGRYAEAEHLHRKALGLMSRTFGEAHTKTAVAYGNLAVNLDNQGKYAAAQQFHETALRMFLAAPKGEATLRAANVYSNLACCLQSQEKDAAGHEMAEKALEVYRDLLAADHPKIATAYNNLAASLQNQEKYADAEPHLRTALAAFRKRLGEGHAATAETHNNLGVNLYHQGRFADADPHVRSALDTLRRAVGEGHPTTAWAYKSLIGNSCARGDYTRAESLAAAAVASFEAARLRLGFAGLDRAVRTPDICPLPGLTVAAARRGKPDAAWQALERNLARGLLDDLTARPLGGEDRERELALLGKLNLLDQRIEVLRGRGAEATADRRKAERDRDVAQAELAQFQAGLTDKYGPASGLVYDLARVQQQLPEGAALVAWVDLPAVPNWHDPRGDHWAGLLKRTGPPVWVQLPGAGDRGAWTAADDRLAGRVRGCVSERHPKEDWKDLADKLAAQRLGPLGDHLTGVRHLIVLPSHALRRVPVEALTARVEGLAGRTVSYAPSGTTFAWLQEKRLGPDPARPARHLLAFGDPAFKTGDGGPDPLPGTRLELAGITRVFDRSSEFKGSEASEQTLDRLAAEEGGLRRFGYLHFATHGVLDPQRPMRSALLLARDRLPDPLARVLAGNEAYDGRLTAERILRRWTLDAELVTLSACRTGLGRHAGGDGYLGFSQALFVAGARSLVVSLWDVDDAATALLMTRFYENLMGIPAGAPGGPVPAVSKAEALARAKEWLRGLKPDEVDLLRKDLPARGTRGRVEKKKPAAQAAAAARSYDHPYYWSGFVLVGDPR